MMTAEFSSGSGGAVDTTGKYFGYDENALTYISAKDLAEYQKLKAQVRVLTDDLMAMFPDGNTFAMIDDPCKYASNTLSTLNKSLKEVMYGKCGCSHATKVEENETELEEEETKMASEMSTILIGWKSGSPTIYEECENIEWTDGNGYDELQFTMNGKDNIIKIMHDAVEFIRIVW